MKRARYEKSKKAYRSARKFLPGGVNSPVRNFAGVGGAPVFIRSGKGSHVADVDGNDYIDYLGSWGPLICGHAHPDVVKAVTKAMQGGSSFGAPTERETELARLVTDAFPSIERLRMVNSGTEATMSAIRIARGYTGRDLVIKFVGCYHGHVDGLLVQAGSGATTFGAPSSPGIPKGYTRNTIALPFNDLDAVKRVCARRGKDIACIIIEPVAGNMGVVPPKAGYLEGLREVTKKLGIVLIFDEVMTGFRVARGGAQEVHGIDPDMTTLGKIIGGGLPVGAYGGKAEIIDCVSPVGDVYQAGTLSGNPLAMAAGIATLKRLSRKGFYEKLEKKSANLAAGLEKSARDAGVPTFHTRVGSMMCTFFTEEPVTDYDSAKKSDTKRYARYFHSMLDRGVYFAPSQFEAAFVSEAHTNDDIERTIAASADVMRTL
ncbi:MAG: glutamate-1-semialdehyde 2,1-aminomutase [Planctomycetes bacterium]|nr:glutamate-1-semialdehyde 2,1-aminomutase [Planctomycetota bacterium]